MHGISRRGFLELAGIAAATAVFRPRPAPAAGKTVTVLHESSFIPPFDDYIVISAPVPVSVIVLTRVGRLPTAVTS